MARAILIKLRYGDQVTLRIFPIRGIHYYHKLSAERYQDSNKWYIELLKKQKQTKAIVGNFSTINMWYLIDYELIKEYLMSQNENFEKFTSLFRIDLSIGKGLVVVNGPTWRRQRGMLSPVFHFEALKDRIPRMRPVLQGMIARLRANLNTPDS